MTDTSQSGADADATTTATTASDTTSQAATTAATTAAATSAAGATAAVQPDWSPDWRLKISGGDEKRAKAYEKYASPKEVADAHLSLQQQLSSGEFKRKLPDNAKPEEIAAWRKDNGIPESPEKYDLNLPDGLVLGEADLPVAKDFTAAMHSANVDQKGVQTALTWWTKNQQAAIAARQTEDAEYKKQSEDVLRAEWGGEYRMNDAAIGNFVAGMPEALSKTVMQARDENGRLLWDNPSFRSHMLKQAYLENPARMIVPGGDGNSVDNINQQLEEIAKVSREEPGRYVKDKGMQERRSKLLAAQAVLQKRAAA